MRLIVITTAAALAVAFAAAAQQAVHPAVAAARGMGAKAWDRHCMACHDLPNNLGDPPKRAVLAKMTAEEVYEALTDGNMKAVGDFMGEDERQAVAMHITQKPLTGIDAPEPATPKP